jgi:hypothetical protein
MSTIFTTSCVIQTIKCLNYHKQNFSTNQKCQLMIPQNRNVCFNFSFKYELYRNHKYQMANINKRNIIWINYLH